MVLGWVVGLCFYAVMGLAGLVCFLGFFPPFPMGLAGSVCFLGVPPLFPMGLAGFVCFPLGPNGLIAFPMGLAVCLFSGDFQCIPMGNGASTYNHFKLRLEFQNQLSL